MYDDDPRETARATTPGDEAIQQAERAMAHLSETIGQLIERLAPVVRPDDRSMEGSDDAPKPLAPVLSDVAQVLRGLANKADRNREQVDHVLALLDF